MRVPLDLVERDVRATAHDLVEVVRGRLVLHVERYHLDGCLEVGSHAAEDIDDVEREPEALRDAVVQLPVLDEVGAGGWVDQRRRVLGVRRAEAVAGMEVLDDLGDLGHARRLERHLGRDHVVGHPGRRGVLDVGRDEQLE